MKRIDDDACREKKEDLKECMRHEVENRGGPCPDTEREEHVTDLTDRGIGQYTFDVALSQCAEAGQKKSGGADYSYSELNRRRQFKKCMGSRDQIHAGSYHRGRMDESARGGWTSHRIRQPRLQRQLRGF